MRKNLALVFVLVLAAASFRVIAKPILASAETVEDSWNTKAPLPQAASGIRAVAVNGKIHIIGGTIHYVYDPAKNDWTAKKTMPTARNYFGVAVCHNKIYTIGGGIWDSDVGYVMSDANEVYDPLTDSWESKRAMLTGRMFLSASEVNGKIYSLGGITGGPSSTVALNEVYDVANDSWMTKTPMSYPDDSHVSAVVDGRIYVIGGQNQIYDPETDKWSLGAPLPEIVWDAAAGVTTGTLAPKRIYVIGGGPNATSYLNLTQVYDPEYDSWTFGAQMLTARGRLAVAVVDDLLYAIGGSPHPWDSFMANEQYTPFGYEAVQPSSTPEPQSDSFPTTLVIASSITVTVFGVGLLVYFKKRKH